MTRHEGTGGVGALVRHTAGMAELAINAGHPDRKHNEYLPYPDQDFTDTTDARLQRGEREERRANEGHPSSSFFAGGKFTIAHVLDRNGLTFVPNLLVYVKSIVAERSYAGFSQFFNPYLCVAMDATHFAGRSSSSF